jgi:hypothetical protein
MYILVFDDWFQIFEQIPTKKTTNNVHCINIKLALDVASGQYRLLGPLLETLDT